MKLRRVQKQLTVSASVYSRILIAKTSTVLYLFSIFLSSPWTNDLVLNSLSLLNVKGAELLEENQQLKQQVSVLTISKTFLIPAFI